MEREWRTTRETLFHSHDSTWWCFRRWEREERRRRTEDIGVLESNKRWIALTCDMEAMLGEETAQNRLFIPEKLTFWSPKWCPECHLCLHPPDHPANTNTVRATPPLPLSSPPPPRLERALSSDSGPVWRAPRRADPGTWPASPTAWSASPPACQGERLQPARPTGDRKREIRRC